MDTENDSGHRQAGSMTAPHQLEHLPPGRRQNELELQELLGQQSPEQLQRLQERLRVQRIAELKAELSGWPPIDRTELLDFLQRLQLDDWAAELEAEKGSILERLEQIATEPIRLFTGDTT